MHINTHQSAIILKSLTDEMHNINYLITLALVKGWIYSEANEQSIREAEMLEKMGYQKDLCGFDKDQIVMARQLGQRISKMAGVTLVGCFQYAVVSPSGEPVTGSRAPKVH